MAGGERNRWLDTATRGIRFGYDRRAVRAELAAHLEDKAADFRRIFPDMAPEEAEARALEDMGDPEEIGRELGRIHRPWLGWLWRASQVLAAGAALWLLSFFLLLGDDAYLGEYARWWDFDGLPDYSVGGGYLPVDDPDQLLALEPGLEQTAQGQRVSLLRAALWREGERQALYLYLRLDNWRFWERGYLREDWLRVTDSLGNSYPLGAEGPGAPWDDGWPYANGLNGAGYGPFHSGYELFLRDVSPEAEWVRLDYGPGETLISFTVKLREGAV